MAAAPPPCAAPATVRSAADLATIEFMVSEQDREYMRRLAAAKSVAHGDAEAEHRRLEPIERLRRSFIMSATMMPEANLGARVDDPSAFYERARARGLCDR